MAAVRDTRWMTTNLKTSAEELSIQEFCIVVDFYHISRLERLNIKNSLKA